MFDRSAFFWTLMDWAPWGPHGPHWLNCVRRLNDSCRSYHRACRMKWQGPACTERRRWVSCWFGCFNIFQHLSTLYNSFPGDFCNFHVWITTWLVISAHFRRCQEHAPKILRVSPAFSQHFQEDGMPEEVASALHLHLLRELQLACGLLRRARTQLEVGLENAGYHGKIMGRWPVFWWIYHGDIVGIWFHTIQPHVLSCFYWDIIERIYRYKPTALRHWHWHTPQQSMHVPRGWARCFNPSSGSTGWHGVEPHSTLWTYLLNSINLSIK